MKQHSVLRLLCTPIAFLAAFSLAAEEKKPGPDPMDWTYIRGPEMNGTSREVGLVDSWSPRGKNLIWHREDLGGSSTPIVMNGRLYTLSRHNPGTPQEGEKVVCVNAKTGETLWENTFNVFLSDVPSERVGWSSVTGDPATGNVYALGVCGWFQCINGETGETIWSRSTSEEFGLLNTFGGRTNYPIVFEDLIIVSGIVIGWGDMAKPTHRFLAFDKTSGEAVWNAGTRPLPYDTNYSPPVITSIAGQAALVVGSGDGAVWAIQARTGKLIWQYKLSRRGLNVSPVPGNGVVYMGHAEENIDDNTMGAIVAIRTDGSGDVTTSKEMWRIKERMVGKSSPLVIGDRVYSFDDRAKLWVLDATTGDQIARIPLGSGIRCSPLYADGKIYVGTLRGRWYTLVPDEKSGAKIIDRQRLDGGLVASPIVSHGRIYITTTESMYCVGNSEKAPKLGSEVPPLWESAASDDTAVAHVQVLPSEVRLYPGKKQQFRVKAFNSNGQLLKSSKATFALEGAGQMSGGLYTSASTNAHTASTLTASVGDVSGTALIRVVPELPWAFDFESGTIPITWVGARYRHIVENRDGGYVMVKRNDIPKGTRSQSWMGHINMHDYTIQADVMGDIKDDKMPDIGLIAQRYTIDMMGLSQQLQVRSWPTQLRMGKTIPFEWKSHVWHTMKLRVENVGDKAIVKGKVWKRGESEPDWMIVAEDDSPNRTGSPGLFGNAKDARIYVDNITITPNE